MPKAIPSNSISNPSFKRDKGISCSSGSAVTHNGGNRLFDFVRDRSCHGNHLVHARDARTLGLRLSERVLSLLFSVISKAIPNGSCVPDLVLTLRACPRVVL